MKREPEVTYYSEQVRKILKHCKRCTVLRRYYKEIDFLLENKDKAGFADAINKLDKTMQTYSDYGIKVDWNFCCHWINAIRLSFSGKDISAFDSFEAISQYAHKQYLKYIGLE